MTTRVGIVGAGVSGVSVALRLRATGHFTCSLFEKSRGLGGRCSTRRLDPNQGSVHLGTDSFTAISAPFRTQVRAWSNDHLVTKDTVKAKEGDAEDGNSRWRPIGNFGSFFKGVSGGVSEGMSVVPGHTVSRVSREKDGGWRIAFVEEGREEVLVDLLVVAVPAEQAKKIVEGTALGSVVAQARSFPRWVVMLGWPGAPSESRVTPRDLPFSREVVEKVVDCSSVTSADGATAAFTKLVVHTSLPWTRANLEITQDDVIKAIKAQLPASLPSPAVAVAHRWRYCGADPETLIRDSHAFDKNLMLGVAGDYFGGGLSPETEGVERAWHSGNALADAIINAQK
jgi:renalase